jgi:3-oxoacyl-(acyl-carrier-protein) synthase/acyl carrier protein
MKDIAIIGFSGVFPDAKSINEFSKNLLDGKCSINEISKKRLFNTSLSEEINYYKAGYLDEITLFDYKFFNISLGEAEEMTPHQRLTLQEAYKTFENAGYRLKDLKGSNTSVYVGDTDTNYYHLAEASSPTLIAGNTSSMLGSRISRFFDLRGLALNVDTACSSSLTAISLACKDLILNETDLALVCGVNISVIPPQKSTKIVLGIEAKNGSCNPFSEKADGTLGGEVVACVLLKTVEQAEADGDTIHGVIKGFGMNQDGGQSASIMAPSSDAQSDVILQALRKAKLTPNDVAFIEAHGTATKLGDPIEIEGISQVFTNALNNDEKVYVSAVKSNIGHTDRASGIVGIIKVLLSFRNNIIYPSINALPLNSYIDFEKAKVEIVTSPISWDNVKKTNKKIAGVSSFGLMGTNAHLILESYEKNNLSYSLNDQDEFLFFFSAKSVTSLNNYLETFKSYIKETTDKIHDISYTLNFCREIYQYRYIAIAKDIHQLVKILENVTVEMFVDSSTDYCQENILVFDNSIDIENETLKNLPDLMSYQFDVLSNAQKCLIVQYYSYHSLVKSGVLINAMIGVGTGGILLKVLKKEMSLDQALQIVDNNIYNEDENNKEALTVRAQKLLSKYPNGLRIIGIGYEGELCNIFKSMISTKLTYDVIGYSLPVLNNLKLLFSLNFNADPRGYYDNVKFFKTELPSYCFDEKRCWLRTTDNPYSPGSARLIKESDKEDYNGTPVVLQLVKMWNEILKTEIQKENDFFELGGHSLNGLQLINRINERFVLNLSIDDLFENGTPEEMSILIESIGDLKPPAKELLVLNDNFIYSDNFDVSNSQKRMWIESQIPALSLAYNININLNIRGEVNITMLKEVIQIMMDKHHSLRTIFGIEEYASIFQKILPLNENI